MKIALLTLAALLPAGLYAGGTVCFTPTIGKASYNLTNKKSVTDTYIRSTASDRDAGQMKMGDYTSDSFNVAAKMDQIGKLDANFKNAKKLAQWAWNGDYSCLGASFDVASVSLTFPVIYGVCGPSFTLSGSVSLAGQIVSKSGQPNRIVPNCKLTGKAGVGVTCGISCAVSVSGYINATGTAGFKPYSSAPYDALQFYTQLTLGPSANAKLVCLTVWEWKNDWKDSGEKVYGVAYY